MIMENSEKLWTGKVPDNWKFYKGKYIFGERSERGNAINLQLLSPTQKYGVIPQSMYDELTSMKSVKVKEDTDLSTFKTIHRGDFCISLRSFQGGFEYSEYEGVVSPAYHVLFSKMDICAGYYKYLFKEQRFIAEMNSYCQSLRDGKNISYFDFGRTLIPFPPLSEQQSIADYLDETCSKIDEIIAEAKASIEEYKELKQSILFETMTRGIQSDRKYKTCDYEWLGKVPEDWSLMKITHILDDNDSYPIGDGDHGLIKTDSYKSEGIPYIRVQNIGWGTPLLMDNVVYISKEDNERIKGSQLKPGDVLFVKTGATIGKTAIVPNNIPISNTTSHVGKITVSKEHNSKYIFYLLSSFIGYKQFWDIACMKATRPELSISEIKQMKVLIPSTRDEEDEIVEYLDNKLPEYETLICIKESLINDLEAYKKSLIYEVVTGKRRVV